MAWRFFSLLAAMVLAAMLWAPGCARLQTANKEPSKLPPIKLAPDAVALDVAFVRLPAIDSENYEAIWQEADEQQFPSEAREKLATNGLRVGIVGHELPAKLRELVDARGSVWDRDNAAAAVSEAANGGNRKRLHVRGGRRSQVYASKTYPTLAVLLSENNEVRGHQLTDAKCLWALKPYPSGDGSVKLDLTPEIEHGEHKGRWVGGEGQFLQQIGPDRLVLDQLRLEATLLPGQWLILSTTPEMKGLGEYFFAEKSSGAVERTFIVVRLSKTQFDDLFAPEQTSSPLATPVE